jgi:aminotransferase in exopolysaccharide biosynthesis
MSDHENTSAAFRDFCAETVGFIRDAFGERKMPLHRPVFDGNEKAYLSECIDSNFVSSVGARVVEFEQRIAAYVGAKHAVATVNGTAALHVALRLAGVSADCEVISQALTFGATCNAICYTGARPVFVDVDRDTMGLSPEALLRFLKSEAVMKDGIPFNKQTGRRIAACLPMHTFGHPCRIDAIASICSEYGIPLVEDAAESLGSWYQGRHTGTFGRLGIFSFNGNKIITTGGGGMIVTDDPALAAAAKHLTTTAKVPHPYEFVHDQVGFNYRMPNLNAALGCAQMEQLAGFLETKRTLAGRYIEYFGRRGVEFVKEPAGARSNYWLNAIVLDSLDQRNEFLERTNAEGVMTRPIWRLMSKLDMFRDCQNDGLTNSLWLEDRVVNIPSSVPSKEIA